MKQLFLQQEKTFSPLTQIIIGVVFAFLNLALCHFSRNILQIPLFMDMVFVYAASFFGLAAGLVCAVVFPVANYLFVEHIADNLPYIVCLITGVLILRFCIKKMGGVKWTTLLLCALVSAILISIEGGIIYSMLFSEFSSTDFAPTVYLIFQLVLSNIPFLAASILARLPVNLADKIIAVFAGYAVFSVCLFLNRKHIRRECQQGKHP